MNAVPGLVDRLDQQGAVLVDSRYLRVEADDLRFGRQPVDVDRLLLRTLNRIPFAGFTLTKDASFQKVDLFVERCRIDRLPV